MRGIRIGSAFGIPVRLDWTFLLVLPLFAWLIGTDVGNLVGAVNSLFGTGIDVGPLTAGNTPFVLGVVAAVGLFACVLLHEFGHSLVAIHYGYDIDSITLWLFGGVARFAEMPEDWRQELAVSIAGPAVSVALGLLSYLAVLALPVAGLPVGTDAALFVFGYLALTNVALAVFNLLPGFPMDGGRVLRALLARKRPYARATQIAAEVGKLFAVLLGLFGLLGFQIFIIGLAFFIYIGAASEAQQTVMRAAFQDVTVADIMTPREELKTVTEATSVAELTDRMFSERHTGYPVMDGDDLVGMVTLDDAQGINEVERDAFRVDDVMATEIASITPESDALDALSTMQEHDVGRLPVIDADGTLVGLISRTDLMTAFNIIQTTGSVDAMRRRASSPFEAR